MKQIDSDSDRFPLVKPRLRYADADTLRRGKGFSYGEISGAAASVQDVKIAGLRIDHMRRSVHDFNVKALKELLRKPSRVAGTQKSKTKAGKKQEKPQKKKSKESKTEGKKDK